MNSSVCFIQWNVRGNEWRRAIVLAALGNAVSIPTRASSRIVRAFSKQIKGSHVVYVHRGSRPQYAIVQGIPDLAGIRAGHIEPLDWIRFDKKKKEYVALYGTDARIVRALRAINADLLLTFDARDVGTAVSNCIARIVPMIPSRRSNGGLYLLGELSKQAEQNIRAIQSGMNLKQHGHALTINILRVPYSNSSAIETAINISHDYTLSLYEAWMRVVTSSSKPKRVAARVYTMAKMATLKKVWHHIKYDVPIPYIAAATRVNSLVQKLDEAIKFDGVKK